MAETKVTRNITLDPDTDALVVAKRDELTAATGDENYSAAIRIIVREWSNFKTFSNQPRRTPAKIGA